MLRFRTKLLLLSIAVFGPAIGILSGFADGAYSAVCLFALPIVVALAGASVVVDFSNPPVLHDKARGRPQPRVRRTTSATYPLGWAA